MTAFFRFNGFNPKKRQLKPDDDACIEGVTHWKKDTVREVLDAVAPFCRAANSNDWEIFTEVSGPDPDPEVVKPEPTTTTVTPPRRSRSAATTTPQE